MSIVGGVPEQPDVQCEISSRIVWTFVMRQGFRVHSHPLDGKVILRGGTEGGAPEHVKAVDEDDCSCEVLPPLGDGVLHAVQAQVQLLDHVPVTVANLGRPRQQEVVRRLPHGLGSGEDGNDQPMMKHLNFNQRG